MFFKTSGYRTGLSPSGMASGTAVNVFQLCSVSLGFGFDLKVMVGSKFILDVIQTNKSSTQICFDETSLLFIV